MRRLLIGLVSVALVVTACTAGGGSTAPPSTINPSASHAPVTLNLWSFYTGRELKEYNKILQGFTAAYPWITITHTGGKSNDDILRAINGGQAPDVAIEAGPDDVAKYCSTNAWIDLTPYIRQDNLSISSVIPPAALKFTSYKGDQCSLPVLSDAYGLYYNTAMFKKAGITSPPTTYSEFAADMKKLTVFNPDGSIKVAGFVPLANFYENAALDNGTWSGAQYYSADGKSAVASDPRWTQLLQWQKSLVDWYGYDKLTKFYASLGGPDSEWGPQQAFETGKVAMALDGEWRVAFIQGDKSKVPYATAPFPVADDMAADYGLGQIGGDVIGIPRGSQHEAEAWLLVKWLATNNDTMVKLATALKNVPTTVGSLNDPTLTQDPHFATFMKIFLDPKSGYKQITPLGTADANLLSAFIEKYLAGKVPLQQGLQQTATQIDNQMALGG